MYYPVCEMVHNTIFAANQVRSEQAVVAHACHGHRYRPLPVPLSGTGQKRGEGV